MLAHTQGQGYGRQIMDRVDALAESSRVTAIDIAATHLSASSNASELESCGDRSVSVQAFAVRVGRRMTKRALPLHRIVQ
jgi:hypothetical protein